MSFIEQRLKLCLTYFFINQCSLWSNLFGLFEVLDLPKYIGSIFAHLIQRVWEEIKTLWQLKFIWFVWRYGWKGMPASLMIFCHHRLCYGIESFMASIWCSAHVLSKGISISDMHTDWRALLRWLVFYLVSLLRISYPLILCTSFSYFIWFLRIELHKPKALENATPVHQFDS